MLAGPAVSSVGGTTLFNREKKINNIKNGKITITIPYTQHMA